jgi:hypothetical protein
MWHWRQHTSTLIWTPVAAPATCATAPAAGLLTSCPFCPCLRAEQSAKLSGTALTLLGGLPGWLVSQPSALDSVLGSISAALQSPDDKLSRNAATTINRLCKHASLASLIATRCGQWVQGVVDTYLARGGVTRRIGGWREPAAGSVMHACCAQTCRPSALAAVCWDAVASPCT